VHAANTADFGWEPDVATSSDAPPFSHRQSDWRAQWKSLGQDWRWEPLIDVARQNFLAERRSQEINVNDHRYPFKDIFLSRADIEWLLASLDEQGPVVWTDENQRERLGLDLSGAILSRVDLRGLPLARLRGGIGGIYNATDDQREAAAVRLDGANLTEAQLEGADLRYAHLERANLSGAYLEGADLSFAHMQRAQLVGARLSGATLSEANLYRANLGGAHLEGADLGKAFLRQADFQRAQLQGADLRNANLEQAILIEANLERADLGKADITRAILSQAHLRGAILTEAHLDGAVVSQANLVRADLWRAHLVGAVLYEAQLDGANMEEAGLDGAVLGEAQMHRATLKRATLRGADLRGARLQGADLREARLEGITLWTTDSKGQPCPPRDLDPKGNEFWVVGDGKSDRRNLHFVPSDNLRHIWQRLDHFPAALPPADLRQAFLDSGTRLDGVTLSDPEHGSIRAADTRWNGANLSVVNWTTVHKLGLGDQRVAKQKYTSNGRKKSPEERIAEYDEAIRANRQLVIALLDEGLDEIAVRFSLYINELEEVSLWRQRDFGKLAASSFLNRLADLLAGYGYKPLRSILSYLTVVIAFALAYQVLGPSEGYNFSFSGWLVLSITSFHGRGLFPAPLELQNAITQLQAAEAVIGLFVEVTLIAIYTRRFFFHK
jgi:uncharacterized protein YjbI with pentapeptide repeats